MRPHGEGMAVEGSEKEVSPNLESPIQPTTIVPAPAIAAPRVFGITELLEMILVNLPLEDRFVLQRVDQHFNATIARSKKLKSIMHLEPQNIPGDQILRSSELLDSEVGELDSNIGNGTALEHALLLVGIRHRHPYFKIGGRLEVWSIFEYDCELAEETPEPRPSWIRVRIGKGGFHLRAASFLRSPVKIHDADRLGEDATLGDILDFFEKHRKCERQRVWVPVGGRDKAVLEEDEEAVLKFDRSIDFDKIIHSPLPGTN
ncbi:hypothetical protein CKM354_000664000 [Cercospora kikuchii]|uniref:F-box domain-containing protein n=1 Tax=Cercospora kikuchii TaxID=84275 RepID=A0A9P3FGQ4_9PEZI|nr:uncharacterized protein CKM354_000664000 [Cercospora kikuchii]GIZ43412.1 hypothetical protein CKM354_000664000 [Cercospora kikuchii]